MAADRTLTRPPRHLADLDPADRRQAAAELGGPPFRADQLARHYFARLTDDPAEMTDLPAAAREELAGALLPRLLSAERELSCDDGTTRKTLWRAFDGALHRVGADALPGPGHHVRVVAGRLRDGLPVLRHRPGRADQEPVRRRDRRPGGGGRPGGGPGRDARRPGPGVQHRVHGHGRAAGQLRQRAAGGAPDHRPGPRRAGHLAAVGHRVHRRPGARHRPAGRGRAGGPARGIAARAGRRAARRAGAGEPALEGGRGARRGVGLRRRHRPPGIHRVRADPGHQRPAVARRPAGRAARPGTWRTST